MRDWKLMAGLLGLAAFLILSALIGGLNILLVIGGGIGAIAFVWLALAYPVVFLVAALFIPQLKEYWPLQPIDQRADLTLTMLAGLAVGVIWSLLKCAGKIDKGPLPKFSAVPRWPLFGFVLFAIVVALSYTYTPAVSYGGTELLRFLGIGTLMLIAPLVIIRTERDLRRFVLLFLGAGGLLALQMVVHLDDRQAATATGDITRIGAGWLMGMAILLILYFRPFE